MLFCVSGERWKALRTLATPVFTSGKFKAFVPLFDSARTRNIQSEEHQVGHVNINLDIDIFVISEPKWLKFGLRADFFKIFGYAKFQLSIFYTLRVKNF